jgi:transmembrane 9 superfamily protein 3
MASPAAGAAPALLLLLAFAVAGVLSDGSDHRYKTGEPVPLYANKVGPFHNPR